MTSRVMYILWDSGWPRRAITRDAALAIWSVTHRIEAMKHNRSFEDYQKWLSEHQPKMILKVPREELLPIVEKHHTSKTFWCNPHFHMDRREKPYPVLTAAVFNPILYSRTPRFIKDLIKMNLEENSVEDEVYISTWKANFHGPESPKQD